MSWQRRLAPLALVVAVSSACSGDGEQPRVDQAAPVTTISQNTNTDTDTTALLESPTTSAGKALSGSIDDAPQSLAFSSSSDLGRLFELEGSAAPAESAGSDTRGALLSDGTVVQATNLRASNGEVWVRINTTDLDSEVLGWVVADSLRPTTQSVERFDQDNATEFRQVSRAVVGDLLDVYANPGGLGSKTGSLLETEVAMHGGNDVLIASGDRWVDVVDSRSQQRIGWVLAGSFTTLSTIEAKASDSTDVDRRANPSTPYGSDISSGDVTAIGCNAQQITFSAVSGSRGSAIVFGNAVPTGTPLRGSTSEFRWSATGGSTVYVDASETVTFTFPSRGTRTWYFTTLREDGQPAYATTGGTAALNASGKAVATDVQEFLVDAGSCAPSELLEPTIDPYIYDLPEDERDEALAAFELELAEFQASGGTVTDDTSENADPDSDDSQNSATTPLSDTDNGSPDGPDPQSGVGEVPVEPVDDGADVVE